MITEILLFAANPSSSQKLALDEECRAIEQNIRDATFRDRVALRTKWAVQMQDLIRELQYHSPKVVHFSGHGDQQDGIVLVAENNRPHYVSGASLMHLFKHLKGQIRVVFLNACYSNVQAKAIAKVVDCVIGMEREIVDGSAAKFSGAFYQAIAFGKSVRAAFDIAKLMLTEAERLIPILHVRRGIDAGSIILVAVEKVPRNPQSAHRALLKLTR